MFESFKAGLIDYRDETNTTRWINGYDFPALARRPREARAIAARACRAAWKASPSIRADRSFRDIRVREALATMFDFEWVNANLFAGLYTRTVSFFDNSELASTGHPASDAERAFSRRFPAPCGPTSSRDAGGPY